MYHVVIRAGSPRVVLLEPRRRARHSKSPEASCLTTHCHAYRIFIYKLWSMIKYYKRDKLWEERERDSWYI